MNKIATYEEAKKGWDKAAVTNPNAAIHPSGAASQEDYDLSGKIDTNKLQSYITEVNRYAIDGGGNGRLINEPECSIIDFGCGNGRMTKHLAEVFKHVYAVDMSYSMLQQIPATLANVTPILAVNSTFMLPADHNRLANVAVSLSVFIHNTYETGRKILKEISANLVPGGWAFLQIPIYATAKEPSTWTDVGVWTLTRLVDAAEAAGFEVMQTEVNAGVFSFDTVGPNHAAFQILRKKYTYGSALHVNTFNDNAAPTETGDVNSTGQYESEGRDTEADH